MKKQTQKNLALLLITSSLIACGGSSSGTESNKAINPIGDNDNQEENTPDPSSASSQEIYEVATNNDILRRSQYVTDGSVVVGSFLQEGDTDTYRLTLKRGLTVTISVDSEVGHTIELLSNKYGILSEESSVSSVSFNTDLAGTYFITMKGAAYGDYELKISSSEIVFTPDVTYFIATPSNGSCLELTEEQKGFDSPNFILGTCLEDSGMIFNGSCTAQLNAPVSYTTDWDASSCPRKLPID